MWNTYELGDDMLKYNIAETADELMLTVEEIREIYDAFFEDADEIIRFSREALTSGDCSSLAKRMHALKGMTLNLRMTELADLATLIELSAKDGTGAKEDQLEHLILLNTDLRKQVDLFYKK